MTKLSPSAAKRITIGRVGATHGVRGEVRAIPLTDFPERFQEMETVMVGDELLHIENCKPHGKFFLLKFREYPVKEDAMRLNGRLISIDREEAGPLGEGEYYTFDIIGLTVFDTDDKELGKVVNVIKTGSNDVYEVVDENGRETLVPALKKVVRLIDIPAGRMEIALLDEF